MAPRHSVIPVERIASRIYLIRDEKVMLDSDLAELYGVPTSRLNEQFKRNRDRFPEDFAFQLNNEEFNSLMSQIVISNRTTPRVAHANPFVEEFENWISQIVMSNSHPFIPEYIQGS